VTLTVYTCYILTTYSDFVILYWSVLYARTDSIM